MKTNETVPNGWNTMDAVPEAGWPVLVLVEWGKGRAKSHRFLLGNGGTGDGIILPAFTWELTPGRENMNVACGKVPVNFALEKGWGKGKYRAFWRGLVNDPGAVVTWYESFDVDPMVLTHDLVEAAAVAFAGKSDIFDHPDALRVVVLAHCLRNQVVESMNIMRKMNPMPQTVGQA